MANVANSIPINRILHIRGGCLSNIRNTILPKGSTHGIGVLRNISVALYFRCDSPSVIKLQVNFPLGVLHFSNNRISYIFMMEHDAQVTQFIQEEVPGVALTL